MDDQTAWPSDGVNEPKCNDISGVEWNPGNDPNDRTGRRAVPAVMITVMIVYVLSNTR